MRALLLVLLLFSTSLSAKESSCEGQVLVVNLANSTVRFTVTQGDAPFSGRFVIFGGEICQSDNGIERIDVWLDPGSVDSGLPEVDQLLVTPQFFHVDEHPRVTFTSNDITRLGMLVEASGTLTINGISRERSVEFRFGESANGWQAKGRFTLPRLAYELGTGEWDNTNYLANEVVVEFDAMLVPSEHGNASNE